MLGDLILDWLSAPGNAIAQALPAAAFTAEGAVGSAYANPSMTLEWIRLQQDLVTGGPGFLFNGGLLAAMLATWLAIEIAILTVRSIVWAKKALLV